MATLAAQFFVDWVFARVKWFTNYAPVGLGVRADDRALRLRASTRRQQKYLFVLAIVALFALVAKNLVRGHVGRSWMAMRDMDVAAEVIGIRPMYAKLSAFAVSSFFVGVAGALWGFVYLGSWEPLAFNINLSLNLLFMVIIGGLGSILGSFFGAAFIVILPIVLNQLPAWLGIPMSTAHDLAPRVHDLRRADRLLPDRRAARARAAVGDRQGEAAALAVPALSGRGSVRKGAYGVYWELPHRQFPKTGEAIRPAADRGGRST